MRLPRVYLALDAGVQRRVIANVDDFTMFTLGLSVGVVYSDVQSR